MDLKKLQSILTIGETVAVEFKRCGNGIESDVPDYMDEILQPEKKASTLQRLCC